MIRRKNLLVKPIDIVLILLAVLPFGLLGCNTVEGVARGVKKDSTVVVNYVNNEDGWIKQTDDWMRENLW